MTRNSISSLVIMLHFDNTKCLWACGALHRNGAWTIYMKLYWISHTIQCQCWFPAATPSPLGCTYVPCWSKSPTFRTLKADGLSMSSLFVFLSVAKGVRMLLSLTAMWEWWPYLTVQACLNTNRIWAEHVLLSELYMRLEEMQSKREGKTHVSNKSRWGKRTWT